MYIPLKIDVFLHTDPHTGNYLLENFSVNEVGEIVADYPAGTNVSVYSYNDFFECFELSLPERGDYMYRRYFTIAPAEMKKFFYEKDIFTVMLMFGVSQ